MNKLALWAGVALVAGSTLWATWPKADPENRAAPRLLMEAAGNARASYQGHQISVVGNDEVQADVMRRGQLARFSYQSRPGQPARIVLERPEGVYVYWPNVHEGWRIQRRPVPDRPVACAQLCATNYRWKTVAGEAGTLTLTAYRRSDNHRARVFWVDTEHEILTRVECYGPDGRPTSGWALSQLKFRDDLPGSLFDPPVTVHPAVELEHPQPADSLEEAAQRVGFTPEIPNWLPEGYQLVELWTETIQGAPSLRLVYSDGLETFSMLETPHASQEPVTSGVAHTRQLEMVKWSDSRLDYTLLGSDSNPAPLELARAFIQSGNSPSPRGVLPIWQRGWQRLGSLF